MNENIPSMKEDYQSEPIEGIPQAIYNKTQIRLMEKYGAVRWIQEGFAERYGDFAEENPDQILAASAGDLEIDDLMKLIANKKEIN
jgi:hypothetical protein